MIKDLGNGGAGLAIDEALAKIIKDIDDRPRDKKKRTLTIKIHATIPNPEDNAIDWDLELQTSVPPGRTPTTRSRYRQTPDGLEAYFRTDSATNPDQPTFADTAPGFSPAAK